ncbi:MAG: FliI/YscN family ATPase [Bdellovibrionaceae bacterium]|nr:FliI/YscN family ATPase [Bdellovibrionales bacterium]MCB9086469.1 FliI/YscN family ATPase [Pseudobdellovibrionaceae bacterium]
MDSKALLNVEKYATTLRLTKVTKDIGKITQVTGFTLKGFLPGACVGSVCAVYPTGSAESFLAEVVGFQDRQVVMMPLGEMRGVGLGSKVELLRQRATVPVGTELLGRVIDGLGRPIDGKGELEALEDRQLYGEASNPLFRPPIDQPLSLGVRAIDGLITVGQGQRVGILAGSGVGKSVLLGMIARNTNADVNVIALIGERGREVREFIEQNLGEEGLKRSVVIVATPDQSPLVRMRGAFVATTIAEYFCDQGNNVLLMMDSLTRFGMAQREIGLSTGEPPASKGYTPSVFALLPKLLERAGRFEGKGSITGLYTVLVEGDDMDDPIGDSVRSIVDGHIVLDRKLAQKGHFPAIDVLQSTSRVMRFIISDHHLAMALFIRENMAVYKEAEDLLNIGAYKEGSNPKIDQAVQIHDGIEAFLRQGEREASPPGETLGGMQNLTGG